MENILPGDIKPEAMKSIRIDIESFIELYNSGKAELVDIRMPYEKSVWQFNFGLQIAGDELDKHIDSLPKDKIIVVACPHSDRSNMARVYLASKGFDVKFLQGGLLGLAERLKGGKAKDIKLA